MGHKKWFLPVLAYIFILYTAGCSRLDKLDLSGRIELERSNNGYLYAGYIHRYDQSFSQDLISPLTGSLFNSSYVSLAELFPKLEFKKTFSVGRSVYVVAVSFAKIPPDQSDYVVKIVNIQGEKIPAAVIAKDLENSGETRGFDENDSQCSLSGSCLLSFIDPASEIECLLKTCYKIEHTPMLLNSDDQLEDTPANNRLFTETDIGNRYFLRGIINPDPGTTVNVNVIDMNLDGLFTNEDMISFDVDSNLLFPLAKKTRLGKYAYIMKLESIDNSRDRYILTIEKAAGSDPAEKIFPPFKNHVTP